MLFLKMQRLNCCDCLSLSFLLVFHCIGCDVPEVKRENSPKQQSLPKTLEQRSDQRLPVTKESTQTVEPPSAVADWVFRPKFFTEYGDAIGGMCFAVKLGDSGTRVLLTSLSLIGPSGGLQVDIPTDDQDNRIRQLSLYDPKTKRLKYDLDAEPLITLPTDHSSAFLAASNRPDCGSVAAFRLNDSYKGTTGILANKPPAKGDTVWIVGRIAGDESTTLFHEATIDWIPPHRSGRALNRRGHSRPNDGYDFISVSQSSTTPKFQGLLGSPVVNRSGEVIAILYTTLTSRKGKLLGYCVPVDKFRKELESAVVLEQPGEVVSLGEYSFCLPSNYNVNAIEKSEQKAVWSTIDPQLGECRIEIRIIPNQSNLDSTINLRRKLLNNTIRSLAKGKSHIGAGNGDPISLPGIEAIKGSFALPLNGIPDPFGREASESGLVLVGINADHLLLLLFRGNSVTAHTTAVKLAEKAFNSLTQINADTIVPQTSAKEVVVKISNLDGELRDTAIRAVMRVLRLDKLDKLSVDTTEEVLNFTFSTETQIDVIADRIRLGSQPTIDRTSGTISVSASTNLANITDEGASPGNQELLPALSILENHNDLLDPEAALERIIEITPNTNSSPDLRKRVATALADALLLWEPPISIFEDVKALKAIAVWDVDVARERLGEFISLGDDSMSKVSAFEVLVPIADVTVVQDAARALAHDSSGHNSDPASEILSRFPKEAEVAILELFENNDYGKELEIASAVELLGKIGSAESLAFVKELQKTHPQEWVQKRVRKSISQIEERLSKDQD